LKYRVIDGSIMDQHFGVKPFLDLYWAAGGTLSILDVMAMSMHERGTESLSAGLF
jgi:hypothetical protein